MDGCAGRSGYVTVVIRWHEIFCSISCIAAREQSFAILPFPRHSTHFLHSNLPDEVSGTIKRSAAAHVPSAVAFEVISLCKAKVKPL